MKFTILCIAITLNLFVRSQDTIHCLQNIFTEAEYALLKGNPNTSKFGEVDALKVLYDLKSDSIYFINSNYYDYHVNFCKEYLSYSDNGWKFNLNNYTTTNNREYLMGTINRFYSKNFFTLEFSVADNIRADQIRFLHQKIKEHFHLTNEIKLFINTNNMRRKVDELSGVPMINADEIYSGQSFQSLNQKQTFGNLRFIDMENIENHKIKTTDIVVINGTPNELPPVAGVITTDFQNPLSHITILCQNRGTPIMALKNAWEDSLLRALKDRAVSFEVSNESYLINSSSKEEIDSFWINKRQSKKRIRLYIDTSVKSILPIDMIHKNAINFVGGKAANFAELYHLVLEKKLKVKTPEGAFAIPFHFYLEHIKNNQIDLLIDQFLSLRKEKIDDKITREYLGEIQLQIIESKIDPKLISAIEKEVLKNPYKRIRFRSSTNAEDLKGFNGAGLYDSKTGLYGDTKKSFENAIKKVWSSVWNYNAFMERDYFGIDQGTIAMGVLCHRSFPNEKANGVVITKNLYRENYRGFVINAQYGEISVVNPPDSVTCEQIICYSDKNDSFYGKKNIAEYLSYSNVLPKNEKQVLSTEEVIQLTKEIAKLKKELYKRHNIQETNTPYYEYGLDLEFKIYGDDRQVYIKQIRPFNN